MDGQAELVGKVKSLQDTLELIRIIVGDDQLSLAGSQVVDFDFRAQALAKTILQAQDVWIDPAPGAFFWMQQTPHKIFRFPH